jgi:hypothetical protein
MDNLIRVRKELKTALDRSGDASKVKMSFMPLIIKVPIPLSCYDGAKTCLF